MPPRMTANLSEGPSVAIRRALLSVSDKTGLLDLANALAARGVAVFVHEWRGNGSSSSLSPTAADARKNHGGDFAGLRRTLFVQYVV